MIPARLLGQKESGGKVEVLIERVLDEHRVLAHVRASKSPKVGSKLILEGIVQAEMVARHDALFELRFLNDEPVLSLLEQFGHMPLPPYIDRPDEDSDKERYQTVYSKHKGAVAAPTAGLHFSEELIEQLKSNGVKTGFVTLHVGAGTFQPVRVDDISQHKMHSEWFEVTAELVQQVQQTKARGGRVIAVGTTSVRCLESASKTGELIAFSGDTDIFITPGYEFKIVDVLITNFHLPESTLIMLVSAFSGRDNILSAYQAAIHEQYRFFSYGDAMFLTKADLTKKKAE